MSNGDAIAIENVWNEFLPLCLVLGKRIYTRIGLQQMEDLYQRMPYWLLQIVRDNRTMPLHDGKVSEIAQDTMMEQTQARLKTLSFNNKDTIAMGLRQ